MQRLNPGSLGMSILAGAQCLALVGCGSSPSSGTQPTDTRLCAALFRRRTCHRQASIDGLILAEWPDAVTRCRAILAGESYEVDDLYDAFAALWTARRISAKKSHAIPLVSARDSNGLPMRIAV
jgi:hypothetical protein